MKILTNNVRILHNVCCRPETIPDTTNILNKHLELGHLYSRKRCTNHAIDEYSKCIELDSTNQDYYYHRGLSYFSLGNYENALIDFYYSLILTGYKLYPDDIKRLKTIKLSKYLEEIFRNHEQGKIDSENIANTIDDINTLNDLDSYKTYIDYCLKKLKKK